jgi:hypothetical protein
MTGTRNAFPSLSEVEWTNPMIGGCMSKRVAVLLIRELSKALLRRRIQDVDSEPFWLDPDQYIECDGGVQLVPTKAEDLITYAKSNHLRALGVVVVAENGEYFDYFNEEAILSPRDRKFAKQLFQAHAHFWFCEIPWLASQQPES